jgi:hypothetical protein
MPYQAFNAQGNAYPREKSLKDIFYENMAA